MSYQLLRGLRVVESSAFVAAPLAGLTLAQHGADVIRVDMIGGGIDYGRLPRVPGTGRSLYWTGLNKGKRSIAVDLKHPEGRELVQALATAPDAPGTTGGVLLTNIGTPWLAHEALAARRADVISCTIQGHADGGTAVDYTVQCATGYPALTGPGSAAQPVNQVLPAWDIACAYHAAFSIMAALDRRRSSGAGAELKLALSDLAYAMLSHLGVLAEAELLQQDRAALGNHVYGAFGRDFATADGRRVMVVGISAGQWRSLVAACDAAEAIARLEARTGLDLTDEAQRFEAREAIAALLEPWFAERPYAEVARVLDAHRVCWGTYRTPREALADDPRCGIANPLFERISTLGVGEHLAAGAALRVTAEAREPIRPAPLLGADTDAVLHEVLGLPAGAIGRLHDTGIVAGPEHDPTFKPRR
ncbi:CoA transferase [Piscinibacter sp. HJYY11]|uniref:CoA transferase n=1 Tax=Piscinibacter sp. HJYY11 TaxID=2801333 RepID=UPI00191E2B0A|nr:CoA transferase [Piscinibacter sp. HJYY11]MBL0730675.1 CoA transferase [Piscinibacter sp. HJYY11]